MNPHLVWHDTSAQYGFDVQCATGMRLLPSQGNPRFDWRVHDDEGDGSLACLLGIVESRALLVIIDTQTGDASLIYNEP